MTCEHTHKDDPENAVCEDCWFEMYKKYSSKEQDEIFK